MLRKEDSLLLLTTCASRAHPREEKQSPVLTSKVSKQDSKFKQNETETRRRRKTPRLRAAQVPCCMCMQPLENHGHCNVGVTSVLLEENSSVKVTGTMAQPSSLYLGLSFEVHSSLLLKWQAFQMDR